MSFYNLVYVASWKLLKCGYICRTLEISQFNRVGETEVLDRISNKHILQKAKTKIRTRRPHTVKLKV